MSDLVIVLGSKSEQNAQIERLLDEARVAWTYAVATTDDIMRIKHGELAVGWFDPESASVRTVLPRRFVTIDVDGPWGEATLRSGEQKPHESGFDLTASAVGQVISLLAREGMLPTSWSVRGPYIGWSTSCSGIQDWEGPQEVGHLRWCPANHFRHWRVVAGPATNTGQPWVEVPASIWRSTTSKGDREAIIAARDPQTSQRRLARLARHWNQNVRFHVASHPNLSLASMRRLARDSDQHVRDNVSFRSDCPFKVFRRIVARWNHVPDWAAKRLARGK